MKNKKKKNEETDANNPVSCCEEADHMVNGAYLFQQKRWIGRSLAIKGVIRVITKSWIGIALIELEITELVCFCCFSVENFRFSLLSSIATISCFLFVILTRLGVRDLTH